MNALYLKAIGRLGLAILSGLMMASTVAAHEPHDNHADNYTTFLLTGIFAATIVAMWLLDRTAPSRFS